MKSLFRRLVFVSTLFVGSTTLIGCASVTMPPPTANANNVEKLRMANLTPTAVGKFSLATGVRQDVDNSLGGLRGSSVRAPSGSFSQQLKDVIVTDLKAAGLYDDRSQIQIGAQLTDSQVDAAISGPGTAKLAAIFTVDKAGQRTFEKALFVDSQWDSSFVGAIAIPEAINQYTALYKALAAKLFDDNEFHAALAK